MKAGDKVRCKKDFFIGSHLCFMNGNDYLILAIENDLAIIENINKDSEIFFINTDIKLIHNFNKHFMSITEERKLKLEKINGKKI